MHDVELAGVGESSGIPPVSKIRTFTKSNVDKNGPKQGTLLFEGVDATMVLRITHRLEVMGVP